MKKLFTLLCTIITLCLMAQLPVSTSPSNRVVVLEKFGGKGCGHCPDGDKRAHDLSVANPGKVIIVSIHTGSYATGTPNFTTTFGDAIRQISGITGYPAGNVNRQVFSNISHMTAGKPAMGRGSWAIAAPQVFNTASYVNIALEGVLNYTTRQLTVNVEVYFTGTPPANMNLNVALLQDSLVSTQSGASNNPAQVLPGGLYMHLNMLRHMLTGNFGETFATGGQGNIVNKQYTYTVPQNINNVDVLLHKLKLVGFVSETTSPYKIITGAYGPVINSINVSVENMPMVTAFELYPNPANTLTNVSFTLNDNNNAKIDIFNAMGQLVYTQNNLNIGQNNITWDCSNQPNGVYYFILSNDTERTVRRISVVH